MVVAERAGGVRPVDVRRLENDIPDVRPEFVEYLLAARAMAKSLPPGQHLLMTEVGGSRVRTRAYDNWFWTLGTYDIQAMAIVCTNSAGQGTMTFHFWITDRYAHGYLQPLHEAGLGRHFFHESVITEHVPVF